MKLKVFLVLAALCAALPAAAQPAPAPAAECRPDPKPRSYNTATYQYWASVDPSYMKAVFDTIYSRWEGSPFQTGDWTELRFNLLRNGRVSPISITRTSRDPENDMEAMRAVARAVLIAKLPPFPVAYPADTIPMMLALGDVSSYGSAVAAAAPTRRILPEASRLNASPMHPAHYTADQVVNVIVDFEITERGRIDMSTVRVVASPHDAFTAEVMKVLPRWRFQPARENCVPVRSSFRSSTTF